MVPPAFCWVVLTAGQNSRQRQAKFNGRTGRPASNEFSIHHGFLLRVNNGLAHLGFAAWIAYRMPSVQPPALSEDGGRRTDGRHITIMGQCIFHRIHGRLAALNGCNTPKSAGKYDHFHIRQLHFLYTDICFYLDSVGTCNGFSTDARHLHRKSGSPQYITGCNGLHFFEALAQNNIDHPNTSFTVL